MPVTYQNTTGGAASDGAYLYELQDVTVSLPDAYPGNVLCIGVVQALQNVPIGGTGTTSQQQYMTAQQFQVSIALPAVPGSGTTFWNLQVDVTSGTVTLQTSSTANPAPINGNNRVIFSHQINAGDTIPWLRAPTMPENWP